MNHFDRLSKDLLRWMFLTMDPKAYVPLSQTSKYMYSVLSKKEHKRKQLDLSFVVSSEELEHKNRTGVRCFQCDRSVDTMSYDPYSNMYYLTDNETVIVNHLCSDCPLEKVKCKYCRKVDYRYILNKYHKKRRCVWVLIRNKIKEKYAFTFPIRR